VDTPVGPIGVVGVLVAASPKTWSVRRRDGTVSVINITAITASRVVPPGRAQRASATEVALIAALGWRAPQMQRLGDWLLRAGGGFTGRANSALALGDPGMTLDAALDLTEHWYGDHALPSRIQLLDRETPAGLGDLLDRRGWEVSPLVHVMTGELGHVLRAAPDLSSAHLELRLDDSPDESWLACYRQDGGTLPPAAREILTNHPGAIFASLRHDGRALAIARATVDDRWAGLFGVEVAAAHRRRGLGAVVSGAALRYAAERGARRTYLQVSADNTPAVELYERLGYAKHHDYVYRQRPEVDVTG
jgi:GNAT superfamily N-acetyltransferase